MTEENSEPTPKRLKTDPENRISDQETVIEEVAGEPADEEEEEDQNGEECSLCMHHGSNENPLLPSHQCPQCKQGAWKVCQCCHELLLSRSCPICRGDYAPIVMHVVPGSVFLNKLPCLVF